MTLYKLTVLPVGQSFLLPANAPMTDIEYEPDGKNIIPFGCRVGACGTCVIRVVDGLEKLNSRSADEREFVEALGYVDDAFRLACQCKLKGSVAVETVG